MCISCSWEYVTHNVYQQSELLNLANLLKNMGVNGVKQRICLFSSKLKIAYLFMQNSNCKYVILEEIHGDSII